MQVIKDLLDKLLSFPEITYEFERRDSLTIRSQTTDKMLNIAFWEKEHMLTFGNWHWHFQNNERENQELVDTVSLIISNKARMKTVKKGGKEIAWELDLPDDVEEIVTRTTGVFGIRLWEKPEVEYTLIQFT